MCVQLSGKALEDHVKWMRENGYLAPEIPEPAPKSEFEIKAEEREMEAFIDAVSQKFQKLRAQEASALREIGLKSDEDIVLAA